MYAYVRRVYPSNLFVSLKQPQPLRYRGFRSRLHLFQVAFDTSIARTFKPGTGFLWPHEGCISGWQSSSAEEELPGTYPICAAQQLSSAPRPWGCAYKFIKSSDLGDLTAGIDVWSSSNEEPQRAPENCRLPGDSRCAHPRNDVVGYKKGVI